MKRFVVDASLAIKWFIPEEHAEFAAFLLDDDCVLEAPDLLRSEFGNILWKKIRIGEITIQKAEQIIKSFLCVPIKYHSSDRLVMHAIELAVASGRTVYDGLYLALAISQGIKMATADKKLTNALRGSPLGDFVIWCEELST